MLNIFKSILFAIIGAITLPVVINGVEISDAFEREVATMMMKMDESVKPCDDFFAFSCGNYNRETKIPNDKVNIDSFSLIHDNLQMQLNAIMSETVNSKDIEPFKMIKNFFASCTDRAIIEKFGVEPMKNYLETFGGWPVVENSWNETSWSLQRTVTDLELLGFESSYLFEKTLDHDSKNASRRVLYLDQPALGVGREYLVRGLADEVVQAYYKYQIETAVYYGADLEKSRIEMRETLDFEISLAKISLPREEQRNLTKLYNPTSVKELQEQFIEFSWLNYFNELLPASLQIDENEIIIIRDKKFFKNLNNLLNDTPKRVIANYLMWRASASSAAYLNDAIRKLRLDFTKVSSGMKEYKPRWKECVGYVSSYIPLAVSSLYVRKYFKDDSKFAASEMVAGIKNEFVNVLKTVPWMDDKTKRAALQKVNAMSEHIGYPQELMDDEKLISYHKHLSIDRNNFLHTIRKITRFYRLKDLSKLREPVNKTDWEKHGHVAIANAYYHWQENSILIPAGLLQGQFFSAERPRFMNFASIGSVIGHEITHGFDDEGSQFDSSGNLIDWWEEDTKKAYLEKARCIIEQYGNYTEPNVDLPLNGINTQGENIADNGGIKIAYRAYKNWVESNGKESEFPGMNYTIDQLFWISVGQTWCSVYRPEEMRNRITTGVHSPGEFRIIGPLSNMEEFSNDFNCQQGSKMNPEHKCKVW